jgi:indolepyruvate ferredoxin oxidoreductase alpha subunit
MKRNTRRETILLGNEAIGRAIVDCGCTVATSYPGTPATEILSAVDRFAGEGSLPVYREWSVNEKSAFEIALINSYAGCRSAVAMKQVGLNVASDSLMSAAYTGVAGGFLLISADDPGPHSSQTEQDSRFMAMFAKIPVLDPSSPREAYEMVRTGLELSEQYSLPVMLRPTTMVCHARQNVGPGSAIRLKRKAAFVKNPSRLAATPKFRYVLHQELNRKLEVIGKRPRHRPALINRRAQASRLCIISSGAACACVLDMLSELKLLEKVALYKAAMPYPLSPVFLGQLAGSYKQVLVVEETYPVMELQIPDRRTVQGKLNGYVPQEGELTPDVLHPIIAKFSGSSFNRVKAPAPGGQRPTLCPGCPHRASYFAIRKAFPRGIYPGDIGCYTLGINMGGVDTCLCMGASINQAAGLYHSYAISGAELPPIVATIGDSTFIHSGSAALINAVYNKARFILVILDNSTTAMTGNQPTAATGIRADGSVGNSISLEKLIAGMGIGFLKVIDPYDVQGFISLLHDAQAFAGSENGGIAVIIARHPCIMNVREGKRYAVTVTDRCTGCRTCIKNFECPALVVGDDDRVTINHLLCTGCGVCVHACPAGAIEIKG